MGTWPSLDKHVNQSYDDNIAYIICSGIAHAFHRRPPLTKKKNTHTLETNPSR